MLQHGNVGHQAGHQAELQRVILAVAYVTQMIQDLSRNQESIQITHKLVVAPGWPWPRRNFS